MQLLWKVVASAHVARWASHFRSCSKVPDADKTIYYSYYRLRASDCDKTTQDNACDNPNECQSDNLNEHHAENDGVVAANDSQEGCRNGVAGG